MSADGFTRLVEHYKAADDTRLARATVEDISLLLALRDSYPEGSPERDQLSFSGGCATRWLAITNSSQAMPVEEVRLQPLLREFIDHVGSPGVGGLSRDAAAVLRAAMDLLSKVVDGNRYGRLTQLINAHGASLRRSDPATSGLAEIADRLEIVNAAALQAAPRREITTFAGLAMLLRGPVLQCRGNVKILDDIPEGCTLVVEEGSCLVNGHLLGNVAASLDAEIRGNHAGVAILARGSVFVGACLNRSTAVSKYGRVLCRRCEEPKMVFAGEELIVLGDTRGGTYMAPKIMIEGAAYGGTFHVSRLLRATRFSPLAGKGPVIEMQRRVACEQVGKLMDEGAGRLMSKLAGARRGIRHNDTLIQVAQLECEHFANNALIYLVGGENSREKLEELNRAERRLAFLDRIIAGIEVLSDAAEDRLARGSRAEGSEQAWRELESELASQIQENAVDEDLAGARDELNTLARRLNGTTGPPSALLSRLREKRLAWLYERKELQRVINQLNDELRQPLPGQEPYDRFLGEASRLDVLTRVMQKARARPAGDRLRERAQSPFLQVMLKTIDARRRRIKAYLESQARYTQEYHELSERLLRQYHLNPPGLDAEDDAPPTVTGYFEEGTTLCTELCFLDESERDAASVLSPSGPPGEHTYRRENDRIVEV